MSGMPIPASLWGAVLVAIGALLLIWWIVRHIRNRNTLVDDGPELWSGKAYRCPKCDAFLEQGYVMLGRGAIWSSREEKPISTLAHIGQSLPNTLSFDLPPATNAAWRCTSCNFLVVDHSRMIRRRETGA